ncbi:MAG: hypothetical protein LBH61_00010 [Dysgonamonadaceae bacterium]|nr:hypothetical protein [Dysgonamonadaceae bacterium]
MKNKYIYSIAALVWIFLLYNLQTGFKSYADEAFFVLGLNPEQPLGIQHSQFFQMSRFLFKLFRLDYTILCSRITAFALVLSTLFFFSFASYRWLEKKGRATNAFGLYASLVFLWGTPVFLSGYEISFSFNHLLVFFATFMLSFYLLWDVAGGTTGKRLLVYATGCFSFPAIMNYFPSGMLVSLALLALILLKERKQWKHAVLSLLVFAAGLLSFATAYHFFVYPVESALNDIITSIKTPAFGTGGYDWKAYLQLVFRYGKKCYLIFLCTLGIGLSYFVNRQRKYCDQTVWCICMVAAMLLLAFLERSFFRYNILLIPVILSGVLYYLSLPSFKKPSFDSAVQWLLLFCFPFIAIQGTNVEIAYKLSYTGFIWVLLLAGYLFRIKDPFLYKLVLYLPVIVILCITAAHASPYGKVRGTVLDSKSEVENHPLFNHIKLRQKQVDYFQEVDSILKIYHFDPHKDRIFALDYDYATLLYLNATNYGGLMHHIENMIHYKPVFFSQENAPDYILFRQDEERLFHKTADRLNWQLYGEYLKYEVGNPEQAHLVGNRILLINKNKKNGLR